VTEAQTDTSRQAAAAYLRELLLRPGRYRPRWEQYAERSRSGQVNQLAIAEVLARHLRNHPRTTADADALPRQLKDTVFRAMSGKLLSRSTLSLFIEAFGFPEQEQERLWKLWEGSSRISVLSGPRAMRPEAAAKLGPAEHRTLSLHDHHYLGADGLPAQHRTIQVIEAVVDGLDRYPYRADTNVLTVEVGQGCSGIVEPFYEATKGIFAIDLLLVKPLKVGETATLEYWTSFHYHTPPRREFRRIVRSSIENVDIRVEFHPARLPRAIYWAVWDGMEGDIVHRERVTMDSQYAVHRYMKLLENAVVGFCWDWA
jgi:hypothetical protein